MRGKLLALLALPLLLLAACGDGGSTDEKPATTDLELAGTTWIAQSATAGGTARELAGSPRLAFDQDSVHLSGGCNGMSGGYAVSGDQVTFEQMAGTMMACEQALMDQDAWLSEKLTAGPMTGTIDGDTLTLSGNDIELVLRDRQVASPDVPLAGTEWSLTSIRTADSVSSLPAGVRTPTLKITDAGKLRVFTGCNNGNATVETGDTILTVGPLMLSRAACEDKDAQETEAAMLTVLVGDVTYSVEEKTLTLTNADKGLVFQAG